MAARIFRINYKSDFILTLNSDAGWMTPFCIKFWTGAPSQAFFAQWDGETYTHCSYDPSEPTKLLVQFDDHHLPIGDLKFQIAYHFTVADFPNDTEDEVINPANITTEIDGQEYQVMLDFTGETAPEIQFALPAYANEAQRIANEQQRIANEEQRIADEQTRIDNEALRISAEQTRQNNEDQRIRNEQTRISQEEARVREFATLKQESEAATTAANNAAALANQKAQLAADKAQLAADKAALAQDAANLANQKAQLAADKAALAQDAADLANQKAQLAQQKAEYAQSQGDYAKQQGDYAKEQGDYAKRKGDDAATQMQQQAQAFSEAQAARQTAYQQAEGTESGSVAGDGSRWGAFKTNEAARDAKVDAKVADITNLQEAVAEGAVYDVSAQNPTAGPNNDGKWGSLSALLSDANLNTLIPTSVRRGGMSIKFVCSSDNKYVQYRLMSNTFNTTVANWQGVDTEITPSSKNLSESGAVANALRIAKGIQNAYLKEDGDIAPYSSPNFQVTDFLVVPNTKNLYIYRAHPVSAENRTYLAFYDKDKKVISVEKDTLTVNSRSISLNDITVPSNAVYFRVTLWYDGFIMASNLDTIYPSLNDVSFMKSHLLNGIYVKSSDHKDIADAFKYIQLKTNDVKDITVQRFHHDDTIVFYEWNNNTWSLYLQLTLTDGVAIGNYLLFSGSTYVVIVDLNYTESEVGTNTKTDIVLLPNCFNIVKNSVDLSDNINPITGEAVGDYVHSEVDGVNVTPGKFITKEDNKIIISDTTYIQYGITELLTISFIKDGVFKSRKSGVSLIFAAVYNKNRQIIGALGGTGSSGVYQYDLSNLASDIAALSLQETAYYIRFNVDCNSYPERAPINYLSESSAKLQPYWTNDDLYDYDKVLTMPKDVVKSMVETASLGQCTALYDNDGYPSLMYKVNPVSIGALSPVDSNSQPILGDYETIHPAFVVNGVTKNLIYIAMFMTSEVTDANNNKHYVSWFGLPPVASLGRNTLRTAFAAKGNGWHLETVYESSLLGMLAAKFNSPMIRGNSNKGRCYDAGYEYECVRMANGGLPGPEVQVAGAKWINGTQPSAWSHNKEKWGIQDVVGGYHEIIDLVNLDYGKVILADDNKFFTSSDDISTFENGWNDTGAAIDRKNNVSNNRWFSNAVTIQDNPEHKYYNMLYQNYECSPAYDNLNLAVRKKLAMLFIVPRLSSQDTAPVFACGGMTGSFNNKANLHFVVRYAEEYQDLVGLGANVVGYNTDEEGGHHNNMGSRLVCIK